MLNFLAEAATDATSTGGLFGMLPMLLIMVGVFYFMLIRPENKRKKEAEQLRSNIKKGDKIMLTAFGAGFTWGAMYLVWAI